MQNWLPEVPSEQDCCIRCGRPFEGRPVYLLDGQRRCLRFALRHRPLLHRSALTALVVGTVLVAINQGTVLGEGIFPAALLWKIPLTYAVPFCVATWGTLINTRVT